MKGKVVNPNFMKK